MNIIDVACSHGITHKIKGQYLSTGEERFHDAYDEIIKRTADLCYELKLCDNTFDISVFFDYLLWYGYLSINHKLTFSPNGRVNNITCFGADVMRGKSVCLNNAELLTRLYDELQYDAFLIGCFIPNEIKYQRHHILNLNREDKVLKDEQEEDYKKTFSDIIDDIIGNIGCRLLGNHAITLVCNGDRFEAFDPTNLSPVIIYPDLTGRYLGGSRHFPLYFKVMLTDLAMNTHNIKEIKELIRCQEKYSYLMDDIKASENYILSYLESNKDKLEEFHEDIKDDIKTVAYTLRR